MQPLCLRVSVLNFLFAALTFANPTTHPTFEIVGKIKSDKIPESSALVTSSKHPGTYWTLNDSGNRPSIFAITREGKLQREARIDAPNVDWEDMALDSNQQIYIADTGNNFRKRTSIFIYQLPEPDPAADDKTPIKPSLSWEVKYPEDESPFDCESLFVLDDKGYLIAKHRDRTEPGVYEFSLAPTDKPIVMKRIATLPLRFPATVTSADVSRDGKWLAVQTVIGPYLFQIDGEVSKAGQVKPTWHGVFIDPKMEAICFDGEKLLATSEDRRIIEFYPPIKNP